MPPQENVTRMREGVEAFNRGDPDAALGLLHPEVEWRTLDAFPDAGTYHGREAVWDFFQAWRDTFRGFRLHLESCEAVDEHRVLATMRVSGEGVASGIEVGSPTFFQLAEFHDGFLVRARMFQTEAEALDEDGAE